MEKTMRKVLFFGLSCCASLTLTAASPATAAPNGADALLLPKLEQVEPGDTLYEIDREVLMQALQRLAALPLEKRATPQRGTIEDWLRYQMLLQLLAPPPAKLAVKTTSDPNNHELLEEEELAAPSAPAPSTRTVQQARVQQRALRMDSREEERGTTLTARNVREREIDETRELRETRTRRKVEHTAPLLNVASTAAMLVALQQSAQETSQRLEKIEAQQRALLEHLATMEEGGDSLATVALRDTLRRFAPLSSTEEQRTHLSASKIHAKTIVLPTTVGATKPQILAEEERQQHLLPADFKRSVFFEVGSTRLNAAARATLDEAVRFLQRFPQVQLQVQGYASPEGSARRNAQLCHGRWQAVRTYLLSKGLSPERLQGQSQAQIDSHSLRAVARRVDLSLLLP